MAANHSYLQKPIPPVVLALSEMVRGWWIGVSKACATCTGRLIVDPPVHPELGSLRCLNCGREVAEVVVTRLKTYVPRLLACPVDGYRYSEMARCPRCANREQVRRSRARKREDAAERDCAACGVVAAMPSGSRCSRCNRRRRKERKEVAG